MTIAVVDRSVRAALLAAMMIALAPSVVAAQPAHTHSRPKAIDLRAATVRALHEVDLLRPAPRSAGSPQANQPKPSWIKRHPVVFGALVGGVAGALIVSAADDPEASPVGFYSGAAIGAGIGWLLGR